MKVNISRQSLYLLTASFLLLIFVLIFAINFLIPEGKEYRNDKAELKKENIELKKYENFRDDVLEKLTELKSDNRNVIRAFDTEFDVSRFEKMNSEYFYSFKIAPQTKTYNEERFSVYEVNTTSQINSPQSFYDFLDAVNKSDWIIGINFPINFKRERELIRSSFTMKVYGLAKDINASGSTLVE